MTHISILNFEKSSISHTPTLVLGLDVLFWVLGLKRAKREHLSKSLGFYGNYIRTIFSTIVSDFIILKWYIIILKVLYVSIKNALKTMEWDRGKVGGERFSRKPDHATNGNYRYHLPNSPIHQFFN